MKVEGEPQLAGQSANTTNAYLQHYTAFVGKFLVHKTIADYYFKHKKPLVEIRYDGTKIGFEMAAG
jgi:hypothetical protein